MRKKFKRLDSVQSGFTLIELVMVIVILGILAAFALPRFADLSGDARKSVVQSAAGAIKSALNIVHVDWLVNGSTPPIGGSILIEGLNISLTRGYPSATTLGILNAANISTNDFIIIHGNPIKIRQKIINCEVTYKSATTTSPPVVTVVTTAC